MSTLQQNEAQEREPPTTTHQAGEITETMECREEEPLAITGFRSALSPVLDVDEEEILDSDQQERVIAKQRIEKKPERHQSRNESSTSQITDKPPSTLSEFSQPTAISFNDFKGLLVSKSTLFASGLDALHGDHIMLAYVIENKYLKDKRRPVNWERIAYNIYSRSGNFVDPTTLSSHFAQMKEMLIQKLKTSILELGHNAGETTAYLWQWDHYKFMGEFRDWRLEKSLREEASKKHNNLSNRMVKGEPNSDSTVQLTVDPGTTSDSFSSNQRLVTTSRMTRSATAQARSQTIAGGALSPTSHSSSNVTQTTRRITRSMAAKERNQAGRADLGSVETRGLVRKLQAVKSEPDRLGSQNRHQFKHEPEEQAGEQNLPGYSINNQHRQLKAVKTEPDVCYNGRQVEVHDDQRTGKIVSEALVGQKARVQNESSRSRSADTSSNKRFISQGPDAAEQPIPVSQITENQEPWVTEEPDFDDSNEEEAWHSARCEDKNKYLQETTRINKMLAEQQKKARRAVEDQINHDGPTRRLVFTTYKEHKVLLESGSAIFDDKFIINTPLVDRILFAYILEHKALKSDDQPIDWKWIAYKFYLNNGFLILDTTLCHHFQRLKKILDEKLNESILSLGHTRHQTTTFLWKWPEYKYMFMYREKCDEDNLRQQVAQKNGI